MAKACKVPDFNPELPLKLSVEKIIKVRFSELFLFRENCIATGDSNMEAIHDMRVAARRLQAVLKLFGKYFPKNRVKSYDKKISRLIKLLKPSFSNANSLLNPYNSYPIPLRLFFISLSSS